MMNEFSMGKRIMTLRKRAGLTQEQLADKLGVSAQAVSKWENDVSCPDITLLPALAELFQVSTDTLLGRSPMPDEAAEPDRANQEEPPIREPETVVLDGEEQDGCVRHFHIDRGSIGFGITLVLVGIAYLMSQTMDFPFPLWGVVWSAALFGLSLAGFLKNFAPILLAPAAIGFYYLLRYLGVAMPFEMSWSLIWPALLILFGLTVLKDALFKKKRRHGFHSGHYRSEYDDASGYVRMDVSFGEDRRRPICDVFRGGDVDVSFGSAFLDLTGAGAFAEDCALTVDVSFGSLELRLPKDVAIINQPQASFGAVNIHGQPGSPRQSLRIESDVSFGSVEIQY